MIDSSSVKTIYMQIAEMIENEILLGHLKEDDQVPSTNDFARIHGINPATARKGLSILAEEEILYKKRGLGMFVSKEGRQLVLEKRQRAFFQETIPDLIAEAGRLEISMADLIREIERKKEEGRNG